MIDIHPIYLIKSVPAMAVSGPKTNLAVSLIEFLFSSLSEREIGIRLSSSRRHNEKQL
jgi:hypothetical protein